MNRTDKYKKTFTLIELIVVIAIIAILSAIVAPSAFRAIEKSKCTRAIQEAKTIKTASLSYYADTGTWPPRYRLTTPLNPFLENPGVNGWNGPYVDKWNAHPWAGHIGWDPALDLDGSGANDGCVVFDDDRPGTGSSDNQGRIPTRSMVKIDEMIDDGNLATGDVQGDGQGLLSAIGELVILVVRDGT